jgi:hypothetical protein
MFDRIVLAYDRGLLVPFTGAGMSADACPLWKEFIGRLEGFAGIAKPNTELDVVSRAARAVRKLRLGSKKGLGHYVTKALSEGVQIPPEQTTALAAIYWPLILTTNYDDLLVAAAHKVVRDRQARVRLTKEEKREPPFLLLGRSPQDCQRVLTSLSQPDIPILWALQGYVGGQAKSLDGACDGNGQSKVYRQEDVDEGYNTKSRELENELVVGHAEYRKVAMAAHHFRRSFAEVFRSRSFLFLGSGLKDKYFLDLFSEVIELYGPSPHPHYAVLEQGEADREFLRQYFGIWVEEIASYKDLPAWLHTLKEEIPARRPRRSDWRFVQGRGAAHGTPAKQADLQIVRGMILEKPRSNEKIVFSAGGSSGQVKISHVGEGILEKHQLDAERFTRLAQPKERRLPLWQHDSDERFWAINARIDPWTKMGAELRPTDPSVAPINPEHRAVTAGGRIRRDLRLISLATTELMQAAQEVKCRHIHSVVLAAGPQRTFPQSYSLQQMIRGWARWRSQARQTLPRLSIYVVAPEILYNLDTGRLDLASALRPDHVKFWLEIRQENQQVNRYVYEGRVDRPIRKVLKAFDITSSSWQLELIPKPCLGWANWSLRGIDAWEKLFKTTLTTGRFGVLSGSTLVVTR